MSTIKNLCVVIVFAFIIASNPSLLTNIVSFFTRILYNSSVMVVEVVGEAAKKASKSKGSDFLRQVPGKTPTTVTTVNKAGKTKASEYSLWMKSELDKFSKKSSTPTSSTTK